MPPASLSTFAVINPGPTTARNSRIRVFQRLRNLMVTFHKHGSNQRPDRINADQQFWIDRSRFFLEKNKYNSETQVQKETIGVIAHARSTASSKMDRVAERRDSLA